MLLTDVPLTTWILLLSTLFLGGLLLFLLAAKAYTRLTLGVCKSKAKMDGKTVVLTGCTSGIGKEVARDLAKRGARLIMACRNVSDAEKVKEELVKESGNSSIVVKKLDLASFKSIRAFAEEVNSEEKRLDVLIHNAGYSGSFARKVTEDGLENTMATNHYGPFLLTHLLIDLLKRSKPSRVVVVASSLYRLATLDLNNPNPTTTFPGYLYYVSKYANIVSTLELARRLEGSGVTANCLHPGLVDTGIWNPVPAPLSWLLLVVRKTLFKKPEEGAQTTLYVAVAEELARVSGKYFSDCQERGLTRAVQDPALGKKFWEISESLVKLQPTDPKL